MLFRFDAGVACHACAAQTLARAVAAAGRSTDDFGWYGKAAFAAVLPDTDGAGAWRFAERAVRAATAAGVPTTCEVFQHPHMEGRRSPPPRPDRRRDRSSHRGDDNDRNEGGGGTGAMPEPAHASRLPERAGMHAMATAREAAVRRQPAVLTTDDLVPHFLDGLGVGLRQVTDVSNLQALLVHPVPRWKRALDVGGAAACLVLLSPVLATAAVAVRVSSPGPVLFRQLRTGAGGRPFVMYKLRTMCVDAEARKPDLRPHSEQDGPAFKMAHDPRVTRVGAVLRRTSIDEIPQLWNVLRGQMSLVGPRPLPVAEAAACQRWHHRRLDVAPGLTCLWQVAGRSRVTFNEWMRMDIGYIRRRGLVRDLKLLAATVPAVLLRRGAC